MPKKTLPHDPDQKNVRNKAVTTPDTPDLLSAARLVIERWSSGDLAEAVRHLQAAVDFAGSEEA